MRTEFRGSQTPSPNSLLVLLVLSGLALGTARAAPPATTAASAAIHPTATATGVARPPSKSTAPDPVATRPTPAATSPGTATSETRPVVRAAQTGSSQPKPAQPGPALVLGLAAGGLALGLLALAWLVRLSSTVRALPTHHSLTPLAADLDEQQRLSGTLRTRVEELRTAVPADLKRLAESSQTAERRAEDLERRLQKVEQDLEGLRRDCRTAFQQVDMALSDSSGGSSSADLRVQVASLRQDLAHLRAAAPSGRGGDFGWTEAFEVCLQLEIGSAQLESGLGVAAFRGQATQPPPAAVAALLGASLRGLIALLAPAAGSALARHPWPDKLRSALLDALVPIGTVASTRKDDTLGGLCFREPELRLREFLAREAGLTESTPGAPDLWPYLVDYARRLRQEQSERLARMERQVHSLALATTQEMAREQLAALLAPAADLLAAADDGSTAPETVERWRSWREGLEGLFTSLDMALSLPLVGERFPRTDGLQVFGMKGSGKPAGTVLSVRRVGVCEKATGRVVRRGEVEIASAEGATY